MAKVQKSSLENKEKNNEILTKNVNYLFNHATQMLVTNKSKKELKNFQVIQIFQNKVRAEISKHKDLYETSYNYVQLESQLKKQELTIEMLKEKHNILKNDLDLSYGNDSTNNE